MRRHEAAALLAVGIVLGVAGVVWLFGPVALLLSGVLLAAAALFVPTREE